MSGQDSAVGHRTPTRSHSEHEYGIVHPAGPLAKTLIVKTVTLPKSPGAGDGVVRGKPEVISTGTWYARDTRRVGAESCGGPLDAATVRTSVAIARTAVDILHHQPEQPGFATDRRSASAGRGGPRLTARANVSSDDPAVIKHASPPWQK
ncbi:hypothetical protein [Nonomuraea sp. NPDC049480]|uniref:hypothetical protein n=1 Tax=Nonomuraea sp. NPDC049480 TaxID=3364353 RepID=UPI00379595C4